MVRRWSYLTDFEQQAMPNSATAGSELLEAYLKRNFRNNVRSKKLQHGLTKVTRKRYSFRKLKNNSFTLLLHASSWAYYIRQSKLSQSKNLFFDCISVSADAKRSLLLLKSGAISLSSNFKILKPNFISQGLGLIQTPIAGVSTFRATALSSLSTSLLKTSLAFRRISTLIVLLNSLS